MRPSLNWVLSRPGFLRIMPNGLEFRDWTVKYSAVDRMTLVRIPFWGLRVAYVLRVNSTDRILHIRLYNDRPNHGPAEIMIRRLLGVLMRGYP
jgi:hypothetical protein